MDDILNFIENNYLKFLSVNLLKLIITTWYKAEDTSLLRKLSMSEKNAEELEINKTDFRSIVYSVIDTFPEKSVFYESPDDQREKLINLLYDQCCEKNKIFPGYVPLALAPLSEIRLKNLIARYEQEDIKNLSPKKRITKISFEYLDISSQLVLLAYIGLNDYWHKLDSDKLCKLINKKVFNNQIVGKSFFTKRNLYVSIIKLVKKDFIQREVSYKKQVKKNSVPRYFVKKDVVEYCAFSKSNNAEIANKFIMLRNALIPTEAKIDIAIQNDMFNEYTKLLEDYNNSEKINHFVITCIQNNRGINYLKLLVEKGINPEYKDQDLNTAMDVLFCKEPDMKVLDYLLKKGFKPRNKIPVKGFKENVSPLLLACSKCYAPLVSYIVNEHLYDDINEFEFSGYTCLHLFVLMGNSTEVIELLIKADADISLRTKNGLNLLTCAVFNTEHPEILEYIIKNNLYGDVYSRDNEGKTALDYAKKLKNSYAIKLLEPLYK